MDKELAKQKIQELVEKYETTKKAGKLKSYSEQETKNGFIEPLFKILGWNTEDKNEVSLEENIIGAGRPDYSFKINDRVQFYLEAKKFSVDIHDPKWANQSISYSWNKGVTWAVLTDFENLKVFNAEAIDKNLSDKLVFDISYDRFIDRFDQLFLLSKEAFEKNLLDKDAEEHGKKLQKVSVSSLLYKDLNESRKLLTDSFARWNNDIDKYLIDEGVQKILDRLIFIRVAEDREVEQKTLRPLVREWKVGKSKQSLFQYMIPKFRELDVYYNSNLFSDHPVEKWEEYDNAIKEVIEKLYGKEGYYQYDFKIMPADVLGTIYENYLGYKLLSKNSKNKKLFGNEKEIIIHKDAKKRKEQGIYYTPTYVVDYIVKNALKPVLDNCKSVADLKKIKILDPSCGSGSFLLRALEVMADKYKDYGYGDKITKQLILLENIYGVDLDEQAVNIARLNLFVASLDKRQKLPDLTKNIKNGNSLISGTDEEMEKQFGKNWRDKKRFNWQEQFPEVFKQGGFDVIIGNPPYLKELDNKELFQEIRKSDFEKYYQGKMDFWYFFLHRSIEILKDKGIMGFITNSYFLKSAGATKLINHLQKEMALIKAVDFQDIKVFEDVSGRHLIHIWEKIKNKNNVKTKFIKLDKNSFNGTIDDNKYTEIPYAEVIKNSQINFENNVKINNENITPLGNLYDVSVGVQESTDKVSKKFLEENKIENFKSGDGVFVLSEQELQELNLNQKEKPIIKKYLNLNDIQRYYIDFNNEYLIYADKEEKIKIANGEYKNIKFHLEKMKQFITSSNAPYGLHRPRDNKYFENPKLICKGMFLSPEFCFDDEKYYVGFSFSVIIQKDEGYSLKYLLGLLNSSFGKNWFNANGKKRGIGVDIGVAMFRNFPVYTADKEQQKEIIILVDKMLELNKELHKIPEYSEKWKSIKSEIEKTDKKIDEEVYKIYELSEK